MHWKSIRAHFWPEYLVKILFKISIMNTSLKRKIIRFSELAKFLTNYKCSSKFWSYGRSIVIFSAHLWTTFDWVGGETRRNHLWNATSFFLIWLFKCYVCIVSMSGPGTHVNCTYYLNCWIFSADKANIRTFASCSQRRSGSLWPGWSNSCSPALKYSKYYNNYS